MVGVLSEYVEIVLASLFDLAIRSQTTALNSLLSSLAISTRYETAYLHIILLLYVSLPSADIISTVEFNHDGEFLATGDKGGRVVIFQRDGTKMRVSPCVMN